MKLKYLPRYFYRIHRREPSRYRNLYKLIFGSRARSIMEIGVYNGHNSRLMIETSLIFNEAEKINYYGFDLFEDISDSEIKREFSKKPLPEAAIKNKLEATGANINLFRGRTDETLPIFTGTYEKSSQKPDFIFVDGGHSRETIENDWLYASKLMDDKTIVVFDDYYENLPAQAGDVGCQEIIKNLDPSLYEVELMEPVNHFEKEWGRLSIRFAKVRLRPTQTPAFKGALIA